MDGARCPGPPYDQLRQTLHLFPTLFKLLVSFQTEFPSFPVSCPAVTRRSSTQSACTMFIHWRTGHFVAKHLTFACLTWRSAALTISGLQLCLSPVQRCPFSSRQQCFSYTVIPAGCEHASAGLDDNQQKKREKRRSLFLL